MSLLLTISKLVKQGVPVFPLRLGTKDGFLNSDNDHGATRDHKVVVDTFWTGDLNYGCSGNGRTVFIDVDDRAAWEQFVAEYGPFPDTLTVETPSGGLHLYFDAGNDVFGQADLIKGKVNVRASGGYVVGPGSTFEGKSYQIVRDVDITPLPEKLRERLKLRGARTGQGPAIASDLDTPDAIAAAKVRLANRPPAIQGESGDQTTFKMACSILDLGLTVETAFQLMLEIYNPKCEPPWEPEDLRKKVENAWDYKTGAIGRDNPARGFTAEPPPSPPARAKLLKYAREISLDAIIKRQSQALVKGLIHPGDLVLVFGPPGAGKTFSVMDMVFMVALGRDWHGHKTTRAPALYCGFEDQFGLEMRTLAAMKVHGDPNEYFAHLDVSVSLVKEERGQAGANTIVEAYEELAAAAGAAVPGIVVIDTKARATAGDNENDAADVMAFVENRAGHIVRKTGAAVIVVHHPNKQGEIRGSSSLEGAAEVVIHVERNEHLRTVASTKVKNGQEGPLLTFNLEIVQLGVDNDGEPVTSCVVKATRSGLKERQARCLELTEKMMREAIAAGEILSSKLQARNSAVGWLVKNQPVGNDFTREEFKDVLEFESLLGLRVESYKTKGKKDASRYQMIFQAAASLPPVSACRQLTGVVASQNGTGGASKQQGNSGG